MKFTANRPELADAARWVVRCIRNNPQLPILSGVLLEVGEGVTLSATNYDNSHRASVSAQVGEPGRVLIPGMAVATFLAAVRGAEVDVEQDGPQLVIRAGATSSRFTLLTVEEYPAVPFAAASDSFVKADHLADAVGRMTGLVSKDSGAQPWEESVHLSMAEGRLNLTCGSRYCLGRIHVPADGEMSAMVPARTLADAVKDMRGMLAVGTDEGTLYLADETRTAALRRMAGEYPKPVDGLLAHDQEVWAKIDREGLSDALKLASTAADGVSLRFEPGSLTLETYAIRSGEARSSITDTLDAEVDSPGDPGVVVADLKYLQPVVAALTDETVAFGWQPGSVKPVSMRGEGARFVFQQINTERPRG